MVCWCLVRSPALAAVSQVSEMGPWTVVDFTAITEHAQCLQICCCDPAVFLGLYRERTGCIFCSKFEEISSLRFCAYFENGLRRLPFGQQPSASLNTVAVDGVCKFQAQCSCYFQENVTTENSKKRTVYRRSACYLYRDFMLL